MIIIKDQMEKHHPFLKVSIEYRLHKNIRRPSLNYKFEINQKQGPAILFPIAGPLKRYSISAILLVQIEALHLAYHFFLPNCKKQHDSLLGTVKEHMTCPRALQELRKNRYRAYEKSASASHY